MGTSPPPVGLSGTSATPEETSAAGAPSTTDAILDAALSVVGERGLRGATTRLIAERAEVNEVTLFRRFGTKSNLIMAAIEDGFARLRSESVIYTGDVVADLTRLATSYRDMLEHFGPAARVILAEVPHDPALASAIRGPKELFVAISAMLARYQEDGVLLPERPESLVPAFLGPIVVPYILGHVAEAAGMDPFRFDPKQHVRRFLSGCAGAGVTETGSADIPPAPAPARTKES